jgi:hypothetical protein
MRARWTRILLQPPFPAYGIARDGILTNEKVLEPQGPRGSEGDHMRRIGWVETTGLIALALVLVAVTGTVAQTDGQTTTSFRDAAADGIRSDGGGDYVDGLDCVGSTRDLKTGATLLRTASHIVCSDSYWQNGGLVLRQAVLDFSDRLDTGSCDPIVSSGTEMLDPCGVNTIPDVRIHTSNAFASQALSRGTKVEIYVSFNPALNNTDFILEYEQNLAVSGDATARTITAGAQATAELYQVVRVRNKIQKISVGRYRMPAQVTIMD